MAAVEGRKYSVGRPGRTKTLKSRVRPDEYEKAEAIADRVGVSLSVYMDLLLLHAQSDLDADGYPTWWPEKELPMAG